MTSYDELKAEMETIQQRMAEAKKNERADALNEANRLRLNEPQIVSVLLACGD